MTDRQVLLKQKKICRFCLTQQIPELSSIYSRDTHIKCSAPLPVQVMAIASIEVFSNDGMPSHVCNYCRCFFAYSYRFKQMCKHADTLLRQFELTGQWPNPLAKPNIPDDLLQLVMQRQKTANKTVTTNAPKLIATDNNTVTVSKNTKPLDNMPKKILNSNPVDSPEPPIPLRLKKEKLDDETILFLDKMENNEELSIDDVQRFIAAADDNQMEFLEDDPSTRTNLPAREEIDIKNISVPSPIKAKPKLLNKSSIRILNKEAELVVEPRLSAPTLKRDNEGNVAMVTEILDPSVPYENENEADPIKNAEPVETDCFPCAHCERSFPLRQLRNIHMVNHSRQRSFKCPECEKSFFSKYDLQKHNLVHTGDRPFKCVVCDKAFTRATLLHRHEKIHTDIPKYICIYCEKPFISKEQMDQHTKRHLKNRPYQCKICDKSFAFKQGVERHEVTHLREQPYPCQYCKQSFSTPSKLARHLTAHAGNRPYPCKFCSKSYLLSHHLTRHLRSHKNGDTSFSCVACDNVFRTRDDLIYHSAVHATKTLICPLCKENFKDLQSVSRHINEHADGEAYACEFCDLLFITADRLEEHTNVNHAEDVLAYSNNSTAQQQIVEADAEAEFNNSENLTSLEETIEEFLVDELVDEQEVIKQDKMKQETHSTVQSDQPQILNQIVFKTNLNPREEENILQLDENNIVVANEPIDAIDNDDNQPPEKKRKVACPFPKQMLNALNQVSGLKQGTRKRLSKTRFTSPQINVTIDEIKVGNAALPSPSIKKTTQPTITSVLNMLPKGVSIRRNTPNNESKINTTANSTLNSSNGKFEVPKTSTISTIKTSPPVKRIITRRSNESSASQQVSNKVQLKQPTENIPSKTGQVIKKFVTESPNNALATSTISKPIKQVTQKPAATTLNKSTENTGVKTMKMMLGDKKVRVQKITVTKAVAAAMAKDGRIHMKDGAMILTKSISK